MSIRRKSCDPCFKARRKCDLEYPICERCLRNSKECHYAYPPQLQPREDADVGTSTTLTGVSRQEGRAASPASLSYHGSHRGDLMESAMWPDMDLSMMYQWSQLRHSSIPKTMGSLGELQPVTAVSPSWSWVVDLIRYYPIAFAQSAETVFIHKDLYGKSFPRPLRAAFGICAGCASMNERNRPLLFQALDGEMTELLAAPTTDTLLEEVVKLQAAVLYQIIRLFYGDLEQRLLAEQQEYMVRLYGLKMIQRADEELGNARLTWETWLFAESIRRTVIVAFKVYTMYTTFKTGKCAENEALRLLPMSTKAGSWNSRDIYLQYPEQDEVITHDDFMESWTVSPRRDIELFEKFLLVGSKGMDTYRALLGNGESSCVDIKEHCGLVCD